MNLNTTHDGSGSTWGEALESLLATIVIAVFVVTFIVQAFQIPSESMENTLLIGDYLLVDKVHFSRHSLWEKVLPYKRVERGDIVVFHYPVHPAEHFVKRVVGVPGDHIRLINRRVYVNGALVSEPYVHYFRPHDAFRDEFPRLDVSFVPSLSAKWLLEMRKLVADNQLVVPEGNYFVMGDNRDDSLDSRYWGFVPEENIVGRPLLIYWSMRNTGPENSPLRPGDRLEQFLYTMSHIIEITRWERTLRLVH